MATTEERRIVEDILSAFDNTHVIELGAHHGHDTSWMLQRCRGDFRYVAVEPDWRNADVLRMRQKVDLSKVQLFNGAIAAVTGPIQFWPCEGNSEASGSIRKPKEHLNYFPKCKFPKAVEIPAISFDDLCESYGLDHVDFIWSDIQGAERDFVAGGQKMLRRTRFLFTEFDDIEFYEGQANRKTLLSMLPEWEVVKQFEENILLMNNRYQEHYV